jgi:hypothetical protein
MLLLPKFDTRFVEQKRTLDRSASTTTPIFLLFSKFSLKQMLVRVSSKKTYSNQVLLSWSSRQSQSEWIRSYCYLERDP